jgi:hypothetical protein
VALSLLKGETLANLARRTLTAKAATAAAEAAARPFRLRVRTTAGVMAERLAVVALNGGKVLTTAAATTTTTAGVKAAAGPHHLRIRAARRKVTRLRKGI